MAEESNDQHLLNKERARAFKEEDAEAAKDRKKNPNLCVATFDYQKILNCPKSETSTSYYYRKYHVANLTFYDIGLHEGTCHVYDEEIAKKGEMKSGACWRITSKGR